MAGTRNYRKVGEKIVKILLSSSNWQHQKTATLLSSMLLEWPEEFIQKNLVTFVNKNVCKDPDDKISIKVYAVLCNETEWDMRYKMNVLSGRLA